MGFVRCYAQTHFRFTPACCNQFNDMKYASNCIPRSHKFIAIQPELFYFVHRSTRTFGEFHGNPKFKAQNTKVVLSRISRDELWILNFLAKNDLNSVVMKSRKPHEHQTPPR
jgi:hypothetical protein